MSTISTKYLRNNMAEVISKLKSGQVVQLSYRQKIIGSLQPVVQPGQPLRRGSSYAVRQFLSSAQFGPIPSNLQNSTKSFKQELSELRDNDLSK